MSDVATLDTPTPSVAPVPAAPATSEPAAPSSVSQRPASMLEALQRQDAATSASTVAPTQEPAAIGQGAPVAQPGVTPAPGPIPFDVHKTALENARLKATQEATATFEREYGWARTVPRERAQQGLALVDHLERDPIGYLTGLADFLGNHPAFHQQLRSQAGRILAGGQAEPQPDVQIVGPDGQPQGVTYSAQALAARDAWRERQIMGQVDQKLRPYEQERRSALEARQSAEAFQRATSATDTIMSRVAKIVEDAPDDQKQAIYLAINERMTAQPGLDAVDAAFLVRDEKIRPILASQAEAKVWAQHAKKAAGNTASGGGATAVPKRPTNARELAAYMESLSAGTA